MRNNTLGETSASSGITERYARQNLKARTRGEKGRHHPVTTACPEAGRQKREKNNVNKREWLWYTNSILLKRLVLLGFETHVLVGIFRIIAKKKKKMARTNKLLTAPINGSVGRRKSIQVDEEVFSRYSGAMCRSGAGGQTAASDPGPELHHSRAGRKTKNDKINATIIHTWDEQTRYY